MKLLSLIQTTGLFITMAFAGHANAGLMGNFNGSVSAITPWLSTLNGDLAADIAADGNAPLSLGTFFSGVFAYNDGAVDSNPNSNVGLYSTGVQSFSIAGGAINNTATTGYVRIADNEDVNGTIQDTYRLGAMDINQLFVINGNNWVFSSAYIILSKPAPSDILTSDSLAQTIDVSAPWHWEQMMLLFSLQGVANSEHYARIGSGAPDQLNVAVPATATLPLMVAALGLLGLRRRTI
jgi:hypothetical protein